MIAGSVTNVIVLIIHPMAANTYSIGTKSRYVCDVFDVDQFRVRKRCNEANYRRMQE